MTVREKRLSPIRELKCAMANKLREITDSAFGEGEHADD